MCHPHRGGPPRLLAALLLCAGCGGCHNASLVQFSWVHPPRLDTHPFGVESPGAEGFKVVLSVRTRSPSALAVTSSDYEVLAGDVPIAAGRVLPSTYAVANDRHQRGPGPLGVRFVIPLAWRQLAEAKDRIPADGRLHCRFRVRVAFSADPLAGTGHRTALLVIPVPGDTRTSVEWEGIIGLRDTPAESPQLDEHGRHLSAWLGLAREPDARSPRTSAAQERPRRVVQSSDRAAAVPSLPRRPNYAAAGHECTDSLITEYRARVRT